MKSSQRVDLCLGSTNRKANMLKEAQDYLSHPFQKKDIFLIFHAHGIKASQRERQMHDTRIRPCMNYIWNLVRKLQICIP